MASKNPLGKAASTAIDAVKHPVSTTGKVVEQAKGTAALGKMLGEHVGKAAASVAAETATAVVGRARGKKPQAKTPSESASAKLRSVPDVNEAGHTVKKSPAKKTTAKKTTAKKTTAKRAPTKKAAAKKKAPAKKKAAAKKSAVVSTGSTTRGTKKAPAKKATSSTTRGSRKITATPADVAAVVESASDRGVTTPVGTTGAAAAVNPSTAEADLNQPGTEDIVEPSTVKAAASEYNQLRKAAERNPE